MRFKSSCGNLWYLNQYKSLTFEEQVVIIFAGVRGHIDKVSADRVREFEGSWLNHMKTEHSSFLDTLRVERELTKSSEAALAEICSSFVKSFI
jgi:F0F1-type ATP synthase alpha subunit